MKILSDINEIFKPSLLRGSISSYSRLFLALELRFVAIIADKMKTIPRIITLFIYMFVYEFIIVSQNSLFNNKSLKI